MSKQADSEGNGLIPPSVPFRVWEEWGECEADHRGEGLARSLYT